MSKFDKLWKSHNKFLLININS